MSLKSSLVAVSLIVSIVATVLVAPFSYAIDWSADQRLTSDYSVDWFPSATVADDGKIWVVWRSDRDGDNGTIYYKVFDGVSWTEDARLVFSASINDLPSVTHTSDGKIWVVWVSDRVGQNENLYYKVFDGVSWSEETQLTSDPYPDTFPSTIETSDGKIWVVWTSPRVELQGDLYYKVFDGASWTEDIRLTSDNETLEEEPSVMQASDGNVWVVFTKVEKLKNKNLYYMVFNGTAWSSDIQLTWDYYHDFHPSVMQAVDGSVWVVWDSDRNHHDNDIYYKVLDVTWSPDTKLTTQLSDDMAPCIVQAADRSVWVFWGSIRSYPPNYDVYYKTCLDFHDLAVADIAVIGEATVFKGENVSVRVTVENQGTSNETLVEVRCRANSTLVGSQIISLLPAGGNVTLPLFVWNTTGVHGGKYVMSAEVLRVEEEWDLADNVMAAGTWVEVRIVGDVCGMFDGVLLPVPNFVVDLDDFMAIAMPGHIFTEYPTWDPVWGPVCDVNGDLRISVGDLLACGLHLGET